MPAKSTFVRSKNKNLFDFCMHYECFSRNDAGQNLNKF